MTNKANPHFLPSAYLTKRRVLMTLACLLALLAVATVLALSLGSEQISIFSFMSQPFSPEQSAILFEIRLPRIALALGTGAALALAGAAYQSLLKNPLADPYVLGVSSGAALGAVLGIVIAAKYPLMRPLLSFAGAGTATLVVYLLGRREEEPTRLILAGIVISTLLSSCMVLLTTLVDNFKLRNITFWLLGDLSSGSSEFIVFLFVAVALGVIIFFLKARDLNLLMLGERDAFSQGVETAQVRRVVFVTASLLTAAAVSTGGAIGYVGLVIPHLIRLAGSADNRLVIPASALAGALMVLLADTAARTLMAPRELPTGAITALIGAPVLGYLLLGQKQFGRFWKPSPPEKQPAFAAFPVFPAKSLLRIVDVCFRYDREILSDISLEIQAGEILALLGPNGAGKSTLLNLAAGKLTRFPGEILLQEKNLFDYSRREVAQQVALVAQTGEINFSLTVMEYVLAGRFARTQSLSFDSGEDVALAWQALAAMDVERFASHFFNQLSSGEKQRVTLARALVQQSPLLLLDEPTAHLDRAHQRALLNLVRQLAHKHRFGVLLVTHEIDLAKEFSDRAMLLKEGRILKAGAAAEVITETSLRELFPDPGMFENS